MLGIKLPALRDPADGWHPWMAHWFPGLMPEGMWSLSLRQLDEMGMFVEANQAS